MQFFRIRNWEKFQHYKKRNPPWVRLYQTLLRQREYQSLSDTSRSHLIGLFLLASQHDNRLPCDQKWLRHELCTKATIDLKSLLDSNWIQYETQDASKVLDASAVLADCVQDACLETEADNTEAEEQRQMLTFGEFQRVHITPEEYVKLRSRLNGSLEVFIERFDHWVNESPEAKHNGIKRRDRHAYESIISWFGKEEKTNGSGRKPTRDELTVENGRKLLSRVDMEN